MLGLLELLSLRDSKIAEQAEEIKSLKAELAKKQRVPSKPDLGGSSQLDKEESAEKEKQACFIPISK